MQMLPSSYMDSQFLYMQPVINHQYMGFDPTGQQQQVMAAQGFPMNPVDLQQQFQQQQMPSFLSHQYPFSTQRIVINQEQEGPDGKQIINQKVLTIVIFESNLEVIQKVKQATEFC